MNREYVTFLFDLKSSLYLYLFMNLASAQMDTNLQICRGILHHGKRNIAELRTIGKRWT